MPPFESWPPRLQENIIGVTLTLVFFGALAVQAIKDWWKK